MKLIRRYIGQQVGAAILLVLAVLLGLDLLSKLIDQAGDLSERYTLWEALWYSLLTMPGEVYQYLPFAALIGCLAGLGTLATTSELVVVRAAGVSVTRIIWMALRPALVITLAGLLIAEFVAPPLAQRAESHRAVAMQKEEVSISKYGVWHRDRDNFVHFNAMRQDGVLLGVTIYRLEGATRLLSALFARSARYEDDHWVLEGVRETRFAADRLQQVEELERRWDTELSPSLLSILMLEPEDLSISGLWRYSGFLEAQGSNAAEYRLAFWNKVTQPIAIISLVLVAASIIFGPLRQSSMGSRVFAGVLIGIVFRISQDMLGPSSLVFGFAPIYASMIPIGVSLLAGWLLLRRRL
ncbi:MAG: LPS export ABC transporter permease LptG [Spongiibacteraceae bacterium]|jgi:lipopolysaccharide export system permease protein|nr:LPS export ABC transporter permease LptG [Spongiibacteraceae bacterium]